MRCSCAPSAPKASRTARPCFCATMALTVATAPASLRAWLRSWRAMMSGYTSSLNSFTASACVQRKGNCHPHLWLQSCKWHFCRAPVTSASAPSTFWLQPGAYAEHKQAQRLCCSGYSSSQTPDPGERFIRLQAGTSCQQQLLSTCLWSCSRRSSSCAQPSQRCPGYVVSLSADAKDFSSGLDSSVAIAAARLWPSAPRCPQLRR
jgi:hypothetical protein